MIFIAAALPCEAAPLIERFGLRRDAQEPKFRIYRNERIRLVITGIGGSAAMIAVTYLLAVNHAQRSDSLISFGIAALYNGGSAFIDGRLYQGRAVRNMTLRRSFYPDLLYRLPYEEAEILTVSSVYRGPDSDSELEKWALPFGDASVPRLIDMEAAYVYEAGCEFIYAHHIFILKVISDAGDTGSVNNTFVKKLMASHTEELAALIGILSAEESRLAEATSKSQEASRLVTDASAAMKLSFYQDAEFRKIADNYAIRNAGLEGIISLEAIAAAAAEAGFDKISNRKEGRLVYEKIRSRLLQP